MLKQYFLAIMLISSTYATEVSLSRKIARFTALLYVAALASMDEDAQNGVPGAIAASALSVSSVSTEILSSNLRPSFLRYFGDIWAGSFKAFTWMALTQLWIDDNRSWNEIAFMSAVTILPAELVLRCWSRFSSLVLAIEDMVQDLFPNRQAEFAAPTEIRDLWKDNRIAPVQSSLRQRLLASAQQVSNERAGQTYDYSPEQREAIDGAGARDTMPLFLNRQTFINLRYNSNPVSGNPLAIAGRSISTALYYWADRGYDIEEFLAKLLDEDCVTYAAHTINREEAYVLGDSLGLSRQEVTIVLQNLPERFIEIAELLKEMMQPLVNEP